MLNKEVLIGKIVEACRKDGNGKMYGEVKSIIGDQVTICLMYGGNVTSQLERTIQYNNTIFTILKGSKNMEKSELEKKLKTLINKESREDDSNTPDFILAEFMMNCLDAFEIASNRREVWYDLELDILNNWEELIMKAIGQVSMCWSDVDKAGVFNSKLAGQIGTKLLNDIKHIPKNKLGEKK